MGEKVYEAIYKIAKNVESDVIHIFVEGSEISGILLDCQDNKCISDVVTLQDVTTKCKRTGTEKHYRWLNIPAHKIIAFTFQCCLIED